MTREHATELVEELILSYHDGAVTYGWRRSCSEHFEAMKGRVIDSLAGLQCNASDCERLRRDLREVLEELRQSDL